MARLKDTFTRSDLFNVPVDSIAVDEGFNVRIDTPESLEDDEALCQSILDNGFYRHRPLTIRQSPTQDGKAILVDGHRRFKAVLAAIARGAEIKTLPCVSEGQGVSDADRTVMLFSSNDGRRLTAQEQAIGVKRLVSYGWTEVEIASKIGKTRQHVTNLLDLAAAPAEVAEMVRAGDVSATEAVKVMRKEGAQAVNVLTEAKRVARENGRGKVTAKTIKAVCEADTNSNDREPAIAVARRVVNLWSALIDTQPEIVHSLPNALTSALGMLKEAL